MISWSKLGSNAIRVWLVVWASSRPVSCGKVNLILSGWLRRWILADHQRGNSAIIGRQTYVVLLWLRRNLPGNYGAEREWGWRSRRARQDVDYSHPGFRHPAERLIRKDRRTLPLSPGGDRLAGGQWARPQVALEPLRLPGFLESCGSATATWTASTPDWASPMVAPADRMGLSLGPGRQQTPSYDLAWRRYQAELTDDFIAWQVNLVRGLVSAEHFVTPASPSAKSAWTSRRWVFRSTWWVPCLSRDPGWAVAPRPEELSGGLFRFLWVGAVRRGCICRRTCHAALGSSPSWSQRLMRPRSGDRPTTFPRTQASCARSSGHLWPGARDSWSTGTGTAALWRRDILGWHPAAQLAAWQDLS